MSFAFDDYHRTVTSNIKQQIVRNLSKAVYTAEFSFTKKCKVITLNADRMPHQINEHGKKNTTDNKKVA